MVTYALFPNAYLNLVRGDAVAERLGDEPELPAPAVATSEPLADADAAASEPRARSRTALPVRELTVEVDGQSYAVRIIGGGVDPGAPRSPPRAPSRRRPFAKGRSSRRCRDCCSRST